jgi:hypothetical protein
MRSSPDPLAGVSAAIRPGLRRALALLLEAFRSAAACQGDPWDFAVEIGELRFANVTKTILRLLVSKELAEHAIEKTQPHDKQRTFVKAEGVLLPEGSCFVLTEAGVRAARLLMKEIPFYDRERRQLWVRGRLIKSLKQHAPDQDTILSSFEELGWPPRIDDPLSPHHGGQDDKLRLRDAINRLNRHQRPHAIQFRGDGSGKGILWEFVEHADA